MRSRNAILGLVGAAGLVAAGSTCAVSFSDYYEAKGGAGGAATTTSGAPTSSGATQPTTGSSPTGSTGGAGTTTGSSPTGSTGGAGGATSTSSTGGSIDRNWPNWKMPNGLSDVTNQGAPNLAAYQDNGNGTVTDTVTGLMWQKAVDPGMYTQPNALLYCSSTLNAGGLGGHTDWRLPTRIELVSLVDLSVFAPSINATYFPSTPSAYFWSATPVAGAPSNAWSVSFSNSYTSSYDMASAYRVRCVR